MSIHCSESSMTTFLAGQFPSQYQAHIPMPTLTPILCPTSWEEKYAKLQTLFPSFLCSEGGHVTQSWPMRHEKLQDRDSKEATIFLRKAESVVLCIFFLKFIWLYLFLICTHRCICFLFIYLFLAALGLRCCTWAFSSCREQGLLSGCGARASLVVERRL